MKTNCKNSLTEGSILPWNLQKVHFYIKNSKHGFKFKTLPIKEQNSENKLLRLTDYWTLQSPTLPDSSIAVTGIYRPLVPQLILIPNMNDQYQI